MNGRRDDDRQEDGVNGSADAGPGTDALEHDLVGQVLSEEPYLAAALEALPAALDRVDLPTGAWDKLAAALTEPAAAAADTAVHGAASVPPTEAGGAARSPWLTSARPTRTRSSGRPGWNWAHPLTWLTAAAVITVVVGLGTWGSLQAGDRARLIDEQRVLAYWMANPDLKMVALRAISEPTAAEDDGPSGRLGVVCILPDGRGLLLQPTPSGRGKSYVVVSRGAGDDATADADLGSGTGNVVRFDLAGAQRVVVMLASGDGERVPIAWADVN